MTCVLDTHHISSEFAKSDPVGRSDLKYTSYTAVFAGFLFSSLITAVTVLAWKTKLRFYTSTRSLLLKGLSII